MKSLRGVALGTPTVDRGQRREVVHLTQKPAAFVKGWPPRSSELSIQTAPAHHLSN